MYLNFTNKHIITVYVSLLFCINLLSGLEGYERPDKPRLTRKKSPRKDRSRIRSPELPLPAPYLRLPVSLDSRGPLLNPGHFFPAAGTGLELLPQSVQELLKPGSPDYSSQNPPLVSSVRVDCKQSRMVVEVDQAFIWSSDPEKELRLGTCRATKTNKHYVYFEHELTECGTKQMIKDDQVVFSNFLLYEPKSRLSPIRRSAAFTLPLSCHFNRYEYSYKIGYRPKLQIRNLFKRMKNREKFSLTPKNALWEPLSPLDSFTLGRPMFFEARAQLTSPGQRLFVHSCFATAEPSHSSTPQFTIVNNYGCMVESKDGRSSFIAHRNDTVRFSVDAFTFHGFEGNQLYMHCSMSVGSSSPTDTNKACSYNTHTNRWEELYGSDSVCSCCDSHCGSSASSETVISSRAWNIDTEVIPTAKEKKMKSKSSEGQKRSSKTVSSPVPPLSPVPTALSLSPVSPVSPVPLVRGFRPDTLDTVDTVDTVETVDILDSVETGEVQSVPDAVSWSIARPRLSAGGGVRGSAVVEEDLEGSHGIFEDIFNMDLHHLPEH